MLKIVISVVGGVIQHIATNTHDVQIVVADYDNINDSLENVNEQIPIEFNYNPDLVFDDGTAHEMLNGILRDKAEIIVKDYLKTKGI